MDLIMEYGMRLWHIPGFGGFNQIIAMDSLLSCKTLADVVLVVHFGIVLFVVLGFPVILIGNRFGWTWVNSLWWRLVHLALIGVVALQAWLGQYCALTELESALRREAGQREYQTSFIEHWLQSVLYYDAPEWAFTLAYTLFGLLVVWTWLRFPPKAARGREGDS